tara:strand:- start:45 stop:587 length:543 start_codon:yes stop_codon:yes gene_type:complete
MDFIEIYDDALPSENCDKLIEYFNNSPQTQGRVAGDEVDPNAKKSTELDHSWFRSHEIAFRLISSTLQEYTDKYIEKYIPLQHLGKWGVDEGFSLKKFEGEDDGFKVWHTEHCMKYPKRILVWMFYLNDAQSGTEFYNYPKIESKKGRLIIWPAGWTHYHRSEPNKGIKYIMSGWYSFKE